MTFPSPSSFALARSRAATRGSTLTQVETEILEEAASSLGHYGRAAEKALAKLETATPDARAEVLQEAADAVWAFLIQREFCGLRDHRYIIREMAIPQAVLNRMGAIANKAPAKK